jgi:hypothetical protein
LSYCCCIVAYTPRCKVCTSPSSTLLSLVTSSLRLYTSRPVSNIRMPEIGLAICAPNTSPNTLSTSALTLSSERSRVISPLRMRVCRGCLERQTACPRQHHRSHDCFCNVSRSSRPGSIAKLLARRGDIGTLRNCSRRKDTLSLMTPTSAATPTHHQPSGHQGQHNSAHTILHSGTLSDLQLR